MLCGVTVLQLFAIVSKQFEPQDGQSDICNYKALRMSDFRYFCGTDHVIRVGILHELTHNF
jgi:hypothetical protein